MRQLFKLVLCLLPVTAMAQDEGRLSVIRETLDLLPMPAETDAPVVLRVGAPEAMREVLTDMAPSQAGFAALARSLPPEIAVQAAVLGQSGAEDRVDLFALRYVALMQGAGVSSMVLALGSGQGAVLGAGALEPFGYVEGEEGQWSRPASPEAALDFFGGGVPGGSYLQIDGDLLRQASDPAVLGSDAALPDAATALIDALILPPGSVLVQAALILNLPEGVGLPIRSLLVADITTGSEDGVVILGDPLGPDETADFVASANGILPEGGPEIMEMLIIDVEGRSYIATQLLEPRASDHPPWRNIWTERVNAALGDGSFWQQAPDGGSD